MKQTLCAFGYFDLEGQRSWVIRRGLEEAGHTVTLCRTEAKGLVPKVRDLNAQWKRLRDSVDALYVVFPGHYIMPLAWWLARRKHIPVILDVFISLYEAQVEDRARVSRWDPRAWLLWLIDALACALADVILIDTEEHRDYFVQHYRIPQEKFLIIPVGCRTDLFHSTSNPSAPFTLSAVEGLRASGQRATNDRPFRVHFHGSFIPLHGIETILGAARALQSEPVIFELAGRGQTFASMQKHADALGLTNTRFVGMKSLQEIPDFIAGADVCLGIFGTGAKAKRVIPTKAFEIIAMEKPLITARTPATEQVFRDRENALLITPGDPHDLAARIRELALDPPLAERIAAGGHRLFLEHFQPKTAVEPLVKWLSEHQ